MPFSLPTTAYCTRQSLRDEGVTEAMCANGRLDTLALLASRYIDKVTGRWFDARTLDLILDGPGTPTLFIPQPIISVTAIYESGDPAAWGTALSAASYRVYNRHMDGNLHPDDRDHPKIERVQGDFTTRMETARWYSGRQTIKVVGKFGYTDPDGSATGKTPDLIAHVCRLLVMREIYTMANVDAREDATKRWRLTSERTRDQSYTLGQLVLHGAFTGDPEIDQILAGYMRPPQMAVV